MPETIISNRKSFKNDEKCFLFYLKRYLMRYWAIYVLQLFVNQVVTSS